MTFPGVERGGRRGWRHAAEGGEVERGDREVGITDHGHPECGEECERFPNLVLSGAVEACRLSGGRKRMAVAFPGRRGTGVEGAWALRSVGRAEHVATMVEPTEAPLMYP